MVNQAYSPYTVQACPVCQGRGTVPVGFYGPMNVSTGMNALVCSSCRGAGVLRCWVNGSVEPCRIVGIEGEGEE